MMKIRLGYVGTPITIPNITYSSTVTYTNYLKLGEQTGLDKIDQFIQSNFHNLKKLILGRQNSLNPFSDVPIPLEMYSSEFSIL